MSDWRTRNARALLRELHAHGLAQDVQFRSLAGEDLRGQVFTTDDDLAGADLAGADLRDARLSGLDLTGATLAGCRLDGAQLDRARLAGADLSGTCLDQASLIGADLRGAVLAGTTWRRARLTGARLSPDVEIIGWGAALPSDPPRLQIAPPPTPITTRVTGLSWHPDGDLLAVAREEVIEIWDLASGAIVTTIRDGRTGLARAFNWSWSSAALSPSGTRLTYGPDGIRRVEPGGGVLWLHSASATAVCWSPDGAQFAYGDEDGIVHIRNTAVGELGNVLHHRLTTGVSSVCSPDGAHLATSLGGTVQVRSTGTGDLVTTLHGHTATGTPVAWSPDGARLATSLGETVQLWNAHTGDLVTSLHRRTATATSMAWSPTGAHLAAADHDSVTVWDPTTGRLVTTIHGDSQPVEAIAWSPDGTQLAVSRRERTTWLWDAVAGAIRTGLRGDVEPVRALAWSPDGTLVATGDWSRFVRLWDAITGRLVTTLYQGTQPVHALAWSPDGTQLAAGGYGGARVFGVTVPPRRRLRRRSGRATGHVTVTAGSVTSLSYTLDGETLAVSFADGSVELVPAGGGEDDPRARTRLLSLPDGGLAVLDGEHRYRLHGNPGGRFWWSSGLCRFEPGELDGYGVEAR